MAKPVKKPVKPRWASAPAEHDYPAAASYLSLVATPAEVEVLLALLRDAPTTRHRVKDILRAARLPLLPASDVEVARDLKKVAAGVELAPTLLVRGNAGAGVPLQIADGYHRVCASYHISEDVEVAGRLAALPAVRG